MSNINVKNDKYQLAILIIVVIAILLVVSAFIFRKATDASSNKDTIGTVLNDGDLVINYIDGQDIKIRDNKEHTYAVTITNSSTSKIYYSIYFSEINKTSGSVSIEDYDGNVLNTLDEDLDFKRLINLQVINPDETLRFKIKIKLNGLNAKLVAVNESLSTDSFADILLSNYKIGTSKTRIGSEIATTEEGLLTTVDNNGNTYYFRGKQENNYVKLGNNLFRIVRINGDGSVRLVLNDLIETSAVYNNNVTDGVAIGSYASLSYASVNSVLQEWYNNNLSDYRTYITNSSFCTDTSFTITAGDVNYPNSYERIFVDGTPDLYCSGDIYVGVIGLLSADEITLAGAYKNVPNEDYYLYNEDIKSNWVTLSSYSLNSSNELRMINVSSDGSFTDGILTTDEVGLRPVISIGTNAKVKGDGTITNPYIIVA